MPSRHDENHAGFEPSRGLWRAPRAAAGLAVAVLLAGCGLTEVFGDDDPPPKKVARAESGEAAGEEAESATAQADGEAEPAEPLLPIPPDDDPRLLLRVSFEPGAAELSEQAQADLADLAPLISASLSLAPDIFAYWGATEDQDPSRTKFFSLKRGMVVRSFLKEHGARVPRIRLREVADAAPDLIDVVRP
jgi:hypothetical protein